MCGNFWGYFYRRIYRTGNKPGKYRGCMGQGIYVGHCTAYVARSQRGYIQAYTQTVAHTLHTLHTQRRGRTEGHIHTPTIHFGTHKYTHLC